MTRQCDSGGDGRRGNRCSSPGCRSSPGCSKEPRPPSPSTMGTRSRGARKVSAGPGLCQQEGPAEPRRAPAPTTSSSPSPGSHNTERVVRGFSRLRNEDTCPQWTHSRGRQTGLFPLFEIRLKIVLPSEEVVQSGLCAPSSPEAPSSDSVLFLLSVRSSRLQSPGHLVSFLLKLTTSYSKSQVL